MSNKISEERKAMYYGGMGLTVLGVIIFISSFFMFERGFDSFMGNGVSSFAARPLIGMGFIVVGNILMNIGAKGPAGSGIILDPEKAREDLKPYSSAAGGMINDAIENIDLIKKNNLDANKGSQQVVKIKCRSCGELNDEDAKFCKSCGDRM